MSVTFQRSEPLTGAEEAVTYREQLARVRRIAAEALRTPGARIAGIVMFVFAPVFARWFASGVAAETETPINPFTYTVR